ncbi:MAG: glycerophosphoryl diester phosphodiesterase membrane domain-containing protein [Candidatus Firestonebacteria bacterium]
MAQNTFDTGEAISYGWEKMKTHFWPLALSFLVMMLVSGAFGLLAGSFEEGAKKLTENSPAGMALSTLALLVRLGSYAISALISAGLINITLKIYNGEKPETADYFKYLFNGWKWVPDMLLAMLILFAGSVILSLPFIAVGYAKFRPFYVNDHLQGYGAGAFLMEASKQVLWFSGFLVLGLLILSVLLYFMLRVYFYPYLIVDKNMTAVQALKKSWELTRGNFWKMNLFFLASCGIMLAGSLVCCVGIFAAVPLVWLATAFVYKKLAGEGLPC